ncbi:MAG TPA: hypothetical protein VK864_19660 [Longimicrobiales bacterium]|nr:hypothetical protein [Longimicrobiales bacterium]
MTGVSVSSRLLEYEVWNRVNKLRAVSAAQDATRALLGRIALLELIPEVVSRARERFPAAHKLGLPHFEP